ncbi:MAG: hypothetical protein ACP5O1_11680 [Phycisphaerae bacterium]
MILPSNPRGIANLPDIRGRATTVATTATATKLKKSPEKTNNVAVASVADVATAAGQGNWGMPDASGPGRPRQIFRLAAPATATKFKKRPEISNNVAVATVASVAAAATAADSLDDLP